MWFVEEFPKRLGLERIFRGYIIPGKSRQSLLPCIQDRTWIPPFVAHGYQVVSLRDVVLNYYVTEPYDPKNPDEGRIAWNDPRIGFDWKIENI